MKKKATGDQLLLEDIKTFEERLNESEIKFPVSLYNDFRSIKKYRDQ